eukprot:scaffold104102_cov16-Tisochrysis_lutea.AAC.1
MNAAANELPHGFLCSLSKVKRDQQWSCCLRKSACVLKRTPAAGSPDHISAVKELHKALVSPGRKQRLAGSRLTTVDDPPWQKRRGCRRAAQTFRCSAAKQHSGHDDSTMIIKLRSCTLAEERLEAARQHRLEACTLSCYLWYLCARLCYLWYPRQVPCSCTCASANIPWAPPVLLGDSLTTLSLAVLPCDEPLQRSGAHPPP